MIIAILLMIIVLAVTGIDYVAPSGTPGHTGSQRQMLYALGAIGVILAVVWFLIKRG